MPAQKPAPRGLALTACVVAVIGVAAVWGGLSLLFPGPCAWMAVVAALDAALLLRLALWPPGPQRAAVAIAVTLATVAVAGYFVATAQIGRAIGLRPFEALPRMSAELALLYAQSNTGWAELLWVAAALVLAWRSAR